MDFNINNLVTLRIEEGLLPELCEQFSYWKCNERVGIVDIEIKRGKVNPPEPIKAVKNFSFFDGGFVYTGTNGTIEYRQGLITIEGMVDYIKTEVNFVKPIMDQILLSKGWCVAHASAVVYNGKAILFPAMGGTGKTNIMLELMSRGAKFIGDDRVLVGQEGEMALYPRWINMLEYNWTIFPELFERAFPDSSQRKIIEKRLRKYRRGVEMKGGNPATRYLKNHYMTSYHCEQRLPPERLFPGAGVGLAAKADFAFFLERTNDGHKVVDSSPQRLARMSVSSMEFETMEFFEMMSALAGIDFLDYRKRTEVMWKFFNKVHCHEIRMGEIKTRNGLVAIVDEIIGDLK